MIWAMHQQQVDAIVRHGSVQLSQSVLPSIAEGTTCVASVTTDPQTGSDPRRSSHLLAVAPDGRLVIRRHAPVVTGGAHADAYLITMAEADESSVSLVYAARADLQVEHNYPIGR